MHKEITLLVLILLINYTFASQSNNMTNHMLIENITAEEITHWNKSAARILKSTNGLTLQINQRQKTQTGEPKERRFLKFDVDVDTISPKMKVSVILKTKNKKHKAIIDIQVTNSFASSRAIESAAHKKGYKFRSTQSGTLIITATSAMMENITILRTAEEQIVELQEAASIAKTLIDWWEHTIKQI